MFIGRYYHKLENKGRVSLPQKFRQKNQTWIITEGLDGGLFVFKESDFKKRLTEIAKRSFTKKTHRDFLRIMVNNAHQSNTDNNGRVSLPEYLIKNAKLKKNLVIVGSFDYLEIWDLDHYHQYLDKLDAEKIAESIDEL